ncbi:MAG: hypothetical protein Unbinned175contig1000_20 [Prokaryotic dsDNA virus sp.]|nr:MAG: hypothetical protein Unbinned175contig1000_20 [Prokaryotic dsDNA virus sp.]|tara:strand:+ start:1230 stop:2522 length:1293 start_codon:yes stop_codon:yes gene_type:complete
MNSVHITLDPTYTSVSGNPMVFVVSGSNIDEFQYQYVLDVRTYPDNTLRTRIKQFPNPSGVAVFDVSHVVGDYIEYDANSFTSSQVFAPAGTEYQRYAITAGEEYGTNASSSVTLYDGLGSIGAPAVTGSQIDGIYSAWAGTLDVTPSSTGAGGGWNFGDYFNEFSGQYILSSQQSSHLGASQLNHKVGRNDYALLPVFDAQSDVVSQNTNIQLLNSVNSVIASYNLPRAQASRYINYIPYGPQNLIDAGYFTQTQIDSAAWMRVRVVGSSIDKSFTIEGCESNYERRNFLFINKWGLWESYGMNTPIRKSTTISRDEVKKPNIPWSSADGRNSFDRRGFDTYNQTQTDNFVIATPYVRDEEAKMISELIESPQVYLQYNSLDMGLGVTVQKTFVPIQITNSSYVSKTSRLQKAFQFNIQYKLANPRPNR